MTPSCPLAVPRGEHSCSLLLWCAEPHFSSAGMTQLCSRLAASF